MGTGPRSTVKELRSDPLPVVWIYPKAYYLMSLWAALAGKKGYEFTCLGRAIEEDGNIYVTDAYAVKHEGTAGGVDMDDEEQIKLMIKLDGEGFDGELVHTKGRVDPSEIRCWTHSHPGTGPGATFWSTIDDACINRFLTGDWCVSIVFDQAGENPKCRIDSKAPRLQITADLQLYVPYLNESEEKKAIELFKQTSSKKGFSVQSPYAHNRRGNYRGSNSYPPYRGAGSSSSTTTTSSSKPASQLPVAKDADVEDEIQARIMALFSLREDQVEEDWIKWCRDASEDFGDFTVGASMLDDDDDDDGVRSIAYYEGDSMTEAELADFHAELDQEEGQTRIPFVDMSGEEVDWDQFTEIDSAGNEVVREAQEDEGGDVEAAGDQEIEEFEVEGEVDVRHDTVPNIERSPLSEAAISKGLDDLGQSILENDLDVDDALVQAQSELGITAEQAENGLRERLGG